MQFDMRLRILIRKIILQQFQTLIWGVFKILKSYNEYSEKPCQLAVCASNYSHRLRRAWNPLCSRPPSRSAGSSPCIGRGGGSLRSPPGGCEGRQRKAPRGISRLKKESNLKHFFFISLRETAPPRGCTGHKFPGFFCCFLPFSLPPDNFP